MNRFAKVIVLFLFLAAALFPGRVSAQECAANWSPNEYKSFVALQDEVKKRYGEVRILRVALCKPGDFPYFQVVIISGNGEVRRVQVDAEN